MEFYNGIFSSDWQFAALAFCALLIGFSKTGIQGAVVVSIPMMALAFGAKESTGVILPMLCFADLIAVAYYRRDADWRLVLKLLPSAVVGFFAALVADSFVSGRGFGILMASCIFIGLVTMFVARGERAQKIAKSGKCAVLFGILGGFTTMIGNAAGPVMSVYLLSAGLPKRSFVGTSAWFFLLVNYMKIPLQVLAWDNIGSQALKAGACGIPFIFIRGAPRKYSSRKILPRAGCAFHYCGHYYYGDLRIFAVPPENPAFGESKFIVCRYARIKSKKGG